MQAFCSAAVRAMLLACVALSLLAAIPLHRLPLTSAVDYLSSSGSDTACTGMIACACYVCSKGSSCTQVGDVLGALVGHSALSLKQLGKYVLEAAVEEEGEDGMLVDSGVADKLMAAALHALARVTSQDEMARQWEQTGLQLDAFFPSVCLQAVL